MNFGELSRKDKIKLIYAYVITPILMILTTGGQIMSELNVKYGYDVALEVSFQEVFAAGFITYFPLIFPPTILRFVCFRRDIGYGEELYGTLILSFVLNVIIMYLFTWTVTSVGLLGELAVYCVLSYGAKKPNRIPRVQRYILTFVTLVAPFLIAHTHHISTPTANSIYLPIGEAIILSIVLNTHIFNPSTTGATDSSSQQEHQGASYRFEESSSKSHSPEDTPEQRLISIGLACIGRKTKMMNRHMTAEQIEERRKIEYPFMKLLAEKYKDEAHRKILAKHFMLFKEMCLFIVFGVILRDKKSEREQIKTDLTYILSRGLTVQIRNWRDDYWKSLTQNFYREYTASKNIGLSLSKSFWLTLPEKYPSNFTCRDIDECSSVSIYEIFRYVYQRIELEHKRQM